MVMGYKNSPQILQRIMDTIFRDIKGKGVEIYMDDIVIYAKTRKEHDRLCREVLKRLMENNIRLNKSKVQFRQEEVKLLGVTVNGRDMKPSKVNKNETLEVPIPKNVSEVRRFLGLSGWFRNFIQDYAGKTLALTNSLKGNGNNWVWTEEMRKEFDNIKEVIKDLGVKKEILIVEVGITSFDHLRAVEVEKKNKYDVLANHCGALHGYKTRIIPYVMTWDGLVTTYHRTYRKELDLDNASKLTYNFGC
jgi:hypothetical protein